MKKLILIIFLLYSSVFPQTDSNALINRLIDSYIENSMQNVESSQIYSLFEYLLDNPVNINKASVADLIVIPFLDYSTAEKIISLRNKLGRFDSLSQLDQLKDVSKRNIDNSKHFLTVTSINKNRGLNKSSKYFKLKLRSRTTSIIQTPKGFTENKFIGTKPKYYSRLKLYYHNNYKAGILIDKDPGERSINDFTSAHLSLNNIGYLKKLIIGDYLVEFGQGLVLWSPYSFSKSAEAVNTVIKRPRTLIEYTSVDENQYLRGISGTVNFNNFNITAFYSYHKIDAGIDSVTHFVKSLPIDGYHRTENELRKHNSTGEKIFGSIISLNIPDIFSLGFLYYRTDFDNTLSLTSNNYLRGDTFSFYSISYNLFVFNFLVNGELAYNGLSFAGISNLELMLNKKFSFVLSFRNYPSNFYNLKSAGFSESGKTQNELGFYTGIKWITKFGIFNLYFDQYKFPAGKGKIFFPSGGKDFLIDYFSNRIGLAKIHVKIKTETRDNQEKGSNIISSSSKSSFRSEILTSVTKNLNLKTRFEFNVFKTDKHSEKGFLMLQDINFALNNNLFLSGRFLLFDTDSYESRIYEFEKDLRGVIFNPALFGRGMKWYILFHYRFLNTLELSVKYSELYKPGEKSLGSGNSEIPVNFDNRISAQLDVKL